MESVCEEEDITSSIDKIKEEEDEKLSGRLGPMRIEATLKAFSNQTERKYVVTGLTPPGGYFNSYSLSGRLWIKHPERLSKASVTSWNTNNYLTRIDAYLPGGIGSATDYFSNMNQPKAWETLERMFSKFKEPELMLVRNWEVDEVVVDGDYDICGYSGQWYGNTNRSQHWTNRTPAAYAPKVPDKAHYRVAGDEVGAVIHIEQRGTWEKEGSPSPEQSLEEMLEPIVEKKPEAGTNSASNGSGATSQAPSGSCDECDGDDCLPGWCEEVGAYAGVFLMDGRYNVH